MSQRTVFALVLLTFLGMVGIYVGAWLAYQKYKAYQSTLEQKGAVGGLLSLLGGQ